MLSSALLALAASLSTVSAVSQGFNYGSTNVDGSAASQSDFQTKFETAKSLVGTSGFTSARLYTTVQAGTANEATSAIPAAIAADTTLLLGMWASSGAGTINDEITALKSAITQYGDAFTSRVVGLSVGSEDLYRISPTGIAAGSNPGADPDTLVSYITTVKNALSGTALKDVPIGHVDTWTAWVNGSNSAVINAVDWIGFDAYPYFQNTQTNSIENGNSLFDDALAATQSAVGSKDIWITETGWPVTGATSNLATPSLSNAKTFWDQVGCPRFGNVNIYWYTLEDQNAGGSTSPSFGITGYPLSTTPLFDLSCSNTTSSSSSSASASSTVASSLSAGASSVASQATGGSLATGGSGLSPASQGAGITASPVPSGAVSPTGSGYASPSGTDVSGGSGSGSGSNGTYTASTLRTSAGSSGATSTGSSAPVQATGAASSLAISSCLALAGLFAVVVAF